MDQIKESADLDIPHRFLSTPLRTSYPPQPDPRMTSLCLFLIDVELKEREHAERKSVLRAVAL
jgi:hypothetical protein